MARNTATDDLTLYAYRRSRIIDEWRDYVDIDIGECVESYEWDVCTDNTYATVLRTLSATGINSMCSIPQRNKSLILGRLNLHSVL
jgi:hypothetical protein